MGIRDKHEILGNLKIFSQLVHLGVGQITVIDGDRVEDTNVSLGQRLPMLILRGRSMWPHATLPLWDLGQR